MGSACRRCPRSAPVATTCKPSNSSKKAAMRSSVSRAATTVASGITADESQRGNGPQRDSRRAHKECRDRPGRPNRPLRLPARSPRPIACPTRTAAAELIPSGTMKVVEITWTAMPCAASDTSSSLAAMTVTTPKTAPSNAICPVAGSPNLTSSRRRAQSGLQESVRIG